MLFASFVTTVNATVLVVGEELNVTGRPTLLFSELACKDGDLLRCHVQHILVLSMAFLGAYV